METGAKVLGALHAADKGNVGRAAGDCANLGRVVSDGFDTKRFAVSLYRTRDIDGDDVRLEAVCRETFQ